MWLLLPTFVYSVCYSVCCLRFLDFLYWSPDFSSVLDSAFCLPFLYICLCSNKPSELHMHHNWPGSHEKNVLPRLRYSMVESSKLQASLSTQGHLLCDQEKWLPEMMTQIQYLTASLSQVPGRAPASSAPRNSASSLITRPDKIFWRPSSVLRLPPSVPALFHGKGGP